MEVDFDCAEMLTAALEGQDAVICALGIGTDAFVHNQLIDAAVAAKVKRFIPSEFSLNIINTHTRRLPIFENKLKVMKHLEESALRSGITYTYVINSIFLEWGLDNNLILDMSQYKPTIFGSGDEPFSTTRMDTAAKAVVGVLDHYAKTENRAVYIHDAVVTQNKLLAIAKKYTPGNVWKPVYVDLAAMKVESDAKIKEGDCETSTLYSYILIALLHEGYGGWLKQTDNHLFGIQEMTEEEVEEVVRAYLRKNQ